MSHRTKILAIALALLSALLPPTVAVAQPSLNELAREVDRTDICENWYPLFTYNGLAN